MKLTCQLQPADLVAFNEYHSAHSKLHRKQRWKYRVIVPIVYLILAAILYTSSGPMGASVLVAFALIWFLFSPLWLRRRYRKHFQKHVAETSGESLKDPMVLELVDEGIRVQSHIGQSVFKYTAVGNIARDVGRTYVYIGKGMALILPEDRIPKDQIAAFVKTIEERKAYAIRLEAAVVPPPLPPR